MERALSGTMSSRESLDIVCEIADILDVGLDRPALSALMDLLEAGVTPEALASVVMELRKAASATENQTSGVL
eukprot:CAMPEP_0195523400 /NCGR_PEP_ID=MMETSP0794_2-20130614/22541_1 /TAXON_ID=515487 /ORGANISM="Stephanopyxis turris, Strain CCMP 815" /LENGTH=72 /DNA_ID=CAMNT_0040653393 /DNA_START=128 /DNA_END=346 /DNA_ORIENTATION=-